MYSTGGPDEYLVPKPHRALYPSNDKFAMHTGYSVLQDHHYYPVPYGFSPHPMEAANGPLLVYQGSPIHTQRMMRPDPNVEVKLDNEELWGQFKNYGTEMIITKPGRRMFPSIKVQLTGLDPTANYVLMMDVVPMDDNRHKFLNHKWTVAGKAEPHVHNKSYMHPDSPATGAQWMKQPVDFLKLKITNNRLDRQGHIILNSMHKYVPRIHVVRTDDAHRLHWETANMFMFVEAAFIAVTAYQNEQITKLKIDNNAFAKGFREPDKLKRDSTCLENNTQNNPNEEEEKKENEKIQKEESKDPIYEETNAKKIQKLEDSLTGSDYYERVYSPISEPEEIPDLKSPATPSSFECKAEEDIKQAPGPSSPPIINFSMYLPPHYQQRRIELESDTCRIPNCHCGLRQPPSSEEQMPNYNIYPRRDFMQQQTYGAPATPPCYRAPDTVVTNFRKPENDTHFIDKNWREHCDNYYRMRYSFPSLSISRSPNQPQMGFRAPSAPHFPIPPCCYVYSNCKVPFENGSSRGRPS